MVTNISNEDFNKLVRFIHSQYGIDLSQKRQLVTSRLTSLLSQKGYNDFGPFVSDLLRRQDPADLELVLNRLTTNYTFCMREQEHFDFFEGTILPELVKKHQKDKVLAIWSAGCSSGEEPALQMASTLSRWWRFTRSGRMVSRKKWKCSSSRMKKV